MNFLLIREKIEKLFNYRSFFIILIIAIVLRIYHFNYRSLSIDDLFDISNISSSGFFEKIDLNSLFNYLNAIIHNDFHPPLYRLTYLPFTLTENEILMKLPSLLFSIASIVLIHFILKKLFNKN